jgi:hypothetical protein
MRRLLYFIRSLQWVAISASFLGLLAIVIALLKGGITDCVVAISANALLYALLAIRSE